MLKVDVACVACGRPLGSGVFDAEGWRALVLAMLRDFMPNMKGLNTLSGVLSRRMQPMVEKGTLGRMFALAFALRCAECSAADRPAPENLNTLLDDLTREAS